MRKLPEVQQAKELMNQAMDWSVFKWLFEKNRVRETADQANDALDRLERNTKSRWNDDAKATFKNLKSRTSKLAREREKPPQSKELTDPGLVLLLEQVLEADTAAAKARNDAEDTFDRAEKQLSTSLAREGCKKAIHSWALHEKAIRKAEGLIDGRHPQAASLSPDRQP